MTPREQEVREHGRAAESALRVLVDEARRGAEAREILARLLRSHGLPVEPSDSCELLAMRAAHAFGATP